MRCSPFVLLASLVAGAALASSAHATDCLCADTFTAGDRVVLLVDAPDGATNLPAGSVGTVVCTTGIEARVLVTWDGWTEGHNSLGFCQCPDLPPGGISNSHWWIGCDEGAVFLPPATVTNVTQSTSHPTLQDALDNANSGDAIEISAGLLAEDDVDFPFGLNVTITGAGIDETIIDGGGGDDPNAILDLQAAGHDRSTVIADLTLRNGANADFFGGGAVKIDGSSPTFRRVRFVDNAGGGPGNGGAHVDSVEGSPAFEHCQFIGGSNAVASALLDGGPAIRFVNCVFVGGSTEGVLVGTETAGEFVNCTVIAGGPTAISFFVKSPNVTNCVFVGGVIGVAPRHSIFQGAPAADGNIDGTPTFVDTPGGDFRLASGSLGIDAADAGTYVALGGGLVDVNGDDRTVDDGTATDTGVGTLTFLDMGAFEHQAGPPAIACPTDLDGNGDTGFADLVALLAAWGSCP